MFCLCVMCGYNIYKPAAAAALGVCEGKRKEEGWWGEGKREGERKETRRKGKKQENEGRRDGQEQQTKEPSKTSKRGSKRNCAACLRLNSVI